MKTHWLCKLLGHKPSYRRAFGCWKVGWKAPKEECNRKGCEYVFKEWPPLCPPSKSER